MSNDIDLTVDQAKKNVAEHEKKHGREMKVAPGQAKRNDVPTQVQFDADPEWSKRGENIDDQPEE